MKITYKTLEKFHIIQSFLNTGFYKLKEKRNLGASIPKKKGFNNLEEISNQVKHLF